MCVFFQQGNGLIAVIMLFILVGIFLTIIDNCTLLLVWNMYVNLIKKSDMCRPKVFEQLQLESHKIWK